MHENDFLHDNKMHRCTFSEQTLITFSTEFLVMNSVCHVCGINTYALLHYSGSQQEQQTLSFLDYTNKNAHSLTQSERNN